MKKVNCWFKYTVVLENKDGCVFDFNNCCKTIKDCLAFSQNRNGNFKITINKIDGVYDFDEIPNYDLARVYVVNNGRRKIVAKYI